MSASEDIYKYDREEQRSMLSAKPWEKDPHFFKVRYIHMGQHILIDIKFSGLGKIL